METQELEKLKFPNGKFSSVRSYTKAEMDNWISVIENFPNELLKITKNLSVEQKNWRYRPDGWNIKQVVHHCADSHMNALMRFKLTLTSDCPTINPYLEAKWAELADSQLDDIEPSLLLIQGLHARWAVLLKSMSNDDFKREFFHPEYSRKMKLDYYVPLYAWHSAHHLAHIANALKFEGKYN